MSIFVETQAIHDAVYVVNSIPDLSLLANIATNVLEALLNDTEMPSIIKLQQVLDLHTGGDILLDLIAYIFERAAYHTLKPDKLSDQLIEIGMSEDAASTIAQVWSELARDLVIKLQNVSFGAPTLLKDHTWATGVTISDTEGSTDDLSIFTKLSLALHDNDANSDEVFEFSMSHDRLTQFHDELERIQQQIDRLAQ